MKLSYEKLDYQDAAVAAVIDTLSGHDDLINVIEIDPEILDDSVRVTLSETNQQYPDSDYLNPFPQFNIEMETGTGKTMVYLKTIMELHRRFGENKFVIVVPSRAIKAGVEDSLNKMRDYLSDVHNTDKYHSFVYDSKQISQLQAFEGSSFEIMLTTVQAFNSENNVINQEYSESFWGGKPIDQIRNANPIVIVDEPQSVDNTENGKGAIAGLHPKVVLRYSATHKEKQYPLLYEFGPVQAYNAHMVKRIEVMGIRVDTGGNIPVVELKSVEFKNGTLQSKVVAYKATESGLSKKIITLKNGDSLAKKTNNDRYQELGEVIEINSNDMFIEFKNGQRSEIGAAEGENKILLTAQMKAMITDHLDRELKLKDKGIKVLSLIFLDSVENYRVYTEDNRAENGQYAKLFEKIYDEVLKSNPKYQELNDYNVPVSQVHDGYFAKDKATKKKPEQYADTKGDTAKDESAYEAIMTDKEGLLMQYHKNKPETNTKAAKLRFIFSHSALKEGWDNPNIFQILTIAAPTNDLTRRQKIGRGLRIPVDQNGKRVPDEDNDINVVTIYANESFEAFALGLQREYIESGILTNKIDADFFTGMIVSIAPDENRSEEMAISDSPHTVTSFEAEKFVGVLKDANLTKDDGIPQLKELKTLNLDEKQTEIVDKAFCTGVSKQVSIALIEKVLMEFNVPEPTNRVRRTKVEITDKNNQDFIDLWNKIAHKVNYRVEFEEQKLIDDVVSGDNPLSEITTRDSIVQETKTKVEFSQARVTGNTYRNRNESFDEYPDKIMDITRQIADKVGLTRRAIIKMILRSQEINNQLLDEIKKNPASFANQAIVKIKNQERKLLNKSLVYVQSDELWSKDGFDSYEATENTLWTVPDEAFAKTLFNKIAVQSKVESQFAESLVKEEKIKYFLKLPDWFKIPTPFGNYNPDWAILAETNGSERLYFVVETKSTNEISDLRQEERDRIQAGQRLYESNEFKDKNVKFEGPIKDILGLKL